MGTIARGARRIRIHSVGSDSFSADDPRIEFERDQLTVLVADLAPRDWRLRKSSDHFTQDGVPFLLLPRLLGDVRIWTDPDGNPPDTYAQAALDANLILRNVDDAPIYQASGSCPIDVGDATKRGIWINDILWPALKADFDAIAAQWPAGPDGIYSLHFNGLHPTLRVNFDAEGQHTAPLSEPVSWARWNKTGWDELAYWEGMIATYEAIKAKLQTWKVRPYILLSAEAAAFTEEERTLQATLGVDPYEPFAAGGLGSAAEFALANEDGSPILSAEIQTLVHRYKHVIQSDNAGPFTVQLNLTTLPSDDRVADLRMALAALYYLLYDPTRPDLLMGRISLVGETLPAYYPEYNIDLGAPTGDTQRINELHSRTYERGIVLLNAHDTQAQVFDAGTGLYEKAVTSGGGTWYDTGSLTWFAVNGPQSIRPNSAGLILRRRAASTPVMWEKASAVDLPNQRRSVSTAVDPLRRELYILYRGTDAPPRARIHKVYLDVDGVWRNVGPGTLPSYSAWHALGYDVRLDQVLIGGRGSAPSAKASAATPVAGESIPAAWDDFFTSSLGVAGGFATVVDRIAVVHDPTSPAANAAARELAYLVSDSDPTHHNGVMRAFTPGTESRMLDVVAVSALLDQGSFGLCASDHWSYGCLFNIEGEGPSFSVRGSNEAGSVSYQQLGLLPATELLASFSDPQTGVIYHIGYHGAQQLGWIYPITTAGPGALTPSTFPTRCFGGWVGDRGDGRYAWLLDELGNVFRNRRSRGDVFAPAPPPAIPLDTGDRVTGLVPHPYGDSFGAVTEQGWLWWFVGVLEPPTLSAGSTKSRGFEGQSLVFTATLNRPATFAVAVDWAVVGSGMNPATTDDFVDGELPFGSVAIQPGSSSASITIPTVFRPGFQNDRTFTITLSLDETTEFPVLLGDVDGRGTIHDADVAPTLTLQGLVTSSLEGDPTQWQALLTAPVSYDVIVNWSVVAHTGAPAPAAPNDFPGSVYPSGTVTIRSGQTGASFTVPTVDDALEEPTETYVVRLEVDASTAGPVTLGTLTSVAALLDDTHSDSDGPLFYTDEATIGRDLILILIREDGQVWDQELRAWSTADRSETVELPMIELDDLPGTHALVGGVPLPELTGDIFARVEEAGDTDHKPLNSFTFPSNVDIELALEPFLDLLVAGTAVDGEDLASVGRLFLELLSVAKGMWRLTREWLPKGQRALTLTLHRLGSNDVIRSFKVTLDDPVESSRRPRDAI